MGMFNRLRQKLRTRQVTEIPAEGVVFGKNVRAGFAYRRGTEGVSAFDLAKEAAAEALKQVGQEDFSIAMVYSAYEFPPKEVAAGIGAAISGPWIGCTTVGEITSAGLFEDSIVVAVISSPHIKVGVGVGQSISEDDEAAGRIAIEMALESLKNKGKTMKEGENFVLVHGSVGGEEGVIRGLQEVVGNIPVVGGTAGNALTENPAYVFANGKAYTNAAVVGLVSSKVVTAIDSGHGWKPTGKIGLVTKTDPPEIRRTTGTHIVYTIDNRPAAEWYAEKISELKGSEITVDTLKQYYPFVTFGGASGLGGTGYPCGVKDPQGRIWARDIHGINADGSIDFWSYIPEGTGIEVLTGTPETLIDRSEASVKELFNKYKKFNPVIMFDYNCCGRKMYLGKVNKLEEEYSKIRKYTKETPLVGFYSMGEQACYAGLNFHCNLTTTRLLITDTLTT